MRGGPFASVGESREYRVTLVHLHRVPDSIVGGDDGVAASWPRNETIALDAVPVERTKHSAGPVDVLAYLDSRHAPT